MKKIIIIIVLLVIAGTITFLILNFDRKGQLQTESNTKETLEAKKNNNQKILVVYFSKTGENYNVGEVEIGNTALMASYIVEYLNADSFEIIPVKKYSDDYQTSTEEAKKEQNENARPKIKNELQNLDEYDTIFIGYPIWWGDLPMIVYTFLESYNFKDKTIIPFNTHEGSGDAGTYATIKEKLPNASVSINGLAIQGKVAREAGGKTKTINWLKQLGY